MGPGRPKQTIKHLDDPLFPASSTPSPLTLHDSLRMFADMQSRYKMTDAGVRGVIQLCRDLLPEGNTLPHPHSFKRWMKDLAAGSYSMLCYDMCPKGCKVFGLSNEKDAIKMGVPYNTDTVCSRCESSRFNAKKKPVAVSTNNKTQSAWQMLHPMRRV
jgi:hypothetical protein